MTRKDPAHGTAARTGWGFLLVLLAAILFAALATLPVTLPALHVHIVPTVPQASNGVTLLPAPRSPRPVALPQVARPIDAAQPSASLPAVDAARETAAVSAEDKRLRTMLHHAARVYQPEVIPSRGSLPTLVLTAAQSTYTMSTLVQYGAVVMLPHHTALLLDNIFVATNARLSLGGDGLRALYLDSGSGGFASIVAWGGSLTFQGTSASPLTIMGWDRTKSAPAADTGYGRPYIREAGGKMTLTETRVSSLGFWSGRTGGVAWTGLTGKPSTGGATDSTFTDDTYGAFVSRGFGVTFTADLFEFNELDGLHIHRYSTRTSVLSSSASRNGGNGFIVSPATQNTTLHGDVSEHNAGNGYYINGRPLATGASASGGSVTPGSGTVLENSAALANGKMGILVEGGTGTVIKADQVCAGTTGIAVRDGTADAVVTGNDVRCKPRSGIELGPSAPGTVVAGDAVVGARTGFLIRNSGAVHLYNNVVTGATVFGVSARGVSSTVSGVGNVISGTGFRAVDARALAPMPGLSSTNTSRWVFHAKVTFWSYLMYHPLAAMWLGILLLVILAWLWSHRRRVPAHPYPASTHWRGESASAESALVSAAAPAPAARAPAAAVAAAAVSAPSFTPASPVAPQPVLAAPYGNHIEATQPIPAIRERREEEFDVFRPVRGRGVVER